MLFVADDEGKIFKLDVVLNYRVRTADDIYFARGKLFLYFAFFCGGRGARQRANVIIVKIFLYKGGVLAGKHFGRRNHRRLIARFYRHKNPRKRHGGFSASDVALQKPVHFLRGMKICENFFHGGFLPRGKPERKARNKAVKLGARYGIRVKARVVAPAFYYLESGNKQEILLQRYPFRALTAVLFALRSVNLYVCVFKRN